jgi:hypothetical protein
MLGRLKYIHTAEPYVPEFSTSEVKAVTCPQYQQDMH